MKKMFNPQKLNHINNQIYPTQYQQQAQNGYPPLCQNFMNIKNEYSPLMNINQQAHMRFQLYNNHNNNHNSHSKSYSLPANFQDSNPQQQFIQQTKQQPPPPRSLNGDIPLPSGWELEKTSTGQAYYIK